MKIHTLSKSKVFLNLSDRFSVITSMVAIQNGSVGGEFVPLVPVIPADGCGFADNAPDVKGNIALVERG